MNIKLVKLSYDYKQQLFDMMDEWLSVEQDFSPSSIRQNDYHDFGYYLENLEIKEETGGRVPDSVFFCLDTERNLFVGAVNIRHYLNDSLIRTGGHIGGGVRPSERRKGYATAMIGLALEECKKLGIQKVLMTCDKDNIGSAKSIRNNGGILENEVVEDGIIEQRYWIPLSKMKQAYLFVHFKEKTTPDGEQVYFGISQDGFHWEAVNGGNPILWCYYGDRGARDFTITFCETTRKYVILGTDLSLSYGMRGKYHHSWEEISRNGSKCLSLWESEDLLHWSEQRLVQLGDGKFGCLWAPDIIFDRKTGEYVVHWSSSHADDDYGKKAIYCSRTKDFGQFTKPLLLYRHPEEEVIDSAIYEENGAYYLFVKRGGKDCRNILLRAEKLEGPYEQMPAFDESTADLQMGVYEAPTAVRLEDGRWCLFLDYYGVPGKGQGYVPFVARSMESGRFLRADEQFSFPYGFKHGTILTITPEQYEALAQWAVD